MWPLDCNSKNRISPTCLLGLVISLEWQNLRDITPIFECFEKFSLSQQLCEVSLTSSDSGNEWGWFPSRSTDSSQPLRTAFGCADCCPPKSPASLGPCQSSWGLWRESLGFPEAHISGRRPQLFLASAILSSSKDTEKSALDALPKPS